jgi:hypothetical protein
MLVTVRVGEIVPPQSTDLLLSTNVPYGHGQSLDRSDRLYVETNGRDCSDYFAQLDLVQDSSFACGKKK